MGPLYSFSNPGAAVAAPGENATTGSGGSYDTLPRHVVGGAGSERDRRAPVQPRARRDSGPGRECAQGRERRADRGRHLRPGRRRARARKPPASSRRRQPQGSQAQACARDEHHDALGPIRLAEPDVFVSTAAGRRCALALPPWVRRRLTLVHRGHHIATAAGRTQVRLRATVQRGRYRLLVSGPAGVSFVLKLRYPRGSAGPAN